MEQIELPLGNAQPDCVMTRDTAQQHFDRLINENRARALWFVKDGLEVCIEHPLAERILDSLAQKCNRADWITVRKLKTWRSQAVK